MGELVFEKLSALDSLPAEWELVDLAVDWSGLPLLLMVEGNGRRPSASTDPEAWYRWNRTPPRAHHIVHLEGQGIPTTTVGEGIGNLGALVQPHEDGWIIGNGRGGEANLYSAAGSFKRTLRLGDAIGDLQTLPNGQIWVSYFDEGVYGEDELSRNGLVCFHPSGEPIFRFAQYAEENHLPWIDDCYALNVAINGQIWVNYYSDFPLLLFRDLQLVEKWLEFGYIGKTFAVRDDGVLYLSRKSTLMFRSFDATSDAIEVDCVDKNKKSLIPTSTNYLHAAARGANFILNTGIAIYSAAL